MNKGKLSVVIILISLFILSLAFPPATLKLILDSDDSISNVISLEEKTIKLFEEDKVSETHSDSLFTILTSINNANNFIFLKPIACFREIICPPPEILS